MFRSQKPLTNPSRELPPGAVTLGRLTGPLLCAVIAMVDGRLQLLPCFGCRPQLSKEAIGGPAGARAQPGQMPPDWGAGPAQRTEQSQAESGHTEAGSTSPHTRNATAVTRDAWGLARWASPATDAENDLSNQLSAVNNGGLPWGSRPGSAEPKS